MRTRFSLTLLLQLACELQTAHAASGETPDALGKRGETLVSPVLELDSDFDQIVGDGHEKPWFIKFYANWCGHCKSVKSAVVETAVALQAKDNAFQVSVGAVDCAGTAAQEALCKRFKVRSYPVLCVIHKGTVYYYTDKPGRPRTAEALTQFAKTVAYPDFGMSAEAALVQYAA